MPKRWKFWKVWKRLRNRRRKPWTLAAQQRRALDAFSQFPRNPGASKHLLPAPLIVSITSYPPRFPWLYRTLLSLLDQTVRPDRIALWIAHEDVSQLPAEIVALQSEHLTIHTCDDLRNFKRLVPALDQYKDSFIVFADDDMYYPDDWLHRLTETFDRDDPTIVCYRGSRITYTSDGGLTSYRTWRDATDARSEQPSTDLLPVNQTGVLYPPGSLPVFANDYGLIQKLSPTSDEVWLFFMWRLGGWRVRRVPGKLPAFAEWPGSQQHALWKMHRGGTKDDHFRTMAEHFGTP
jgi:hypothetical protein